MERPDQMIPAFDLFGETGRFPDILHVERIIDRAALHDWVISPHRHGFLHQFFLIETPGARVTIDGRETELGGDAAVSIPPWIVHGFRFRQGTRGYVLTLPVDNLPALLGADSACGPVLATPGVLAEGAALRGAFAAVREELPRQGRTRDTALLALATWIGARIARGLEETRQEATAARPERHMMRFDALLRRDLAKRRAISDYAEDLGMSTTHLNRLVRRTTGLSAAAYVESRLFQEARRQLAYTRLPVSEVGYQLGFGDPAYFSRAFRRHCGESPGDYRRRVDPANG
ncbi:helix-turn-helix domain-containing protein [Pseudooceanicola nanhaiensis]|uniref:helix-turn-helix domain-containing protein n=1 Tax=Pseudooceanicola nanhaiensis TaxID=375761 RepID=UPI001CD273AE|nr:helix-turn-helix domain-containing protein [Pseudooceanicola nanhaiensis]MCA0921961.1 helix-turn-helix domain-containing protein [Pseudooceanicola nanhaiensis]